VQRQPEHSLDMPVLDHLKQVFQAEFGQDFSRLPNRDNTLFVIVQHGFDTIGPMMDMFFGLGISKQQVFMTTKPHTTPDETGPVDMLGKFKRELGEHYVPFQWSEPEVNPHSTAASSNTLAVGAGNIEKSQYKKLTAVTHEELFKRFCAYLLHPSASARIKNIVICDEGGKFLNKFIDFYNNPDTQKYSKKLSDFHVVAIEHTKCGTYAEALHRLPFPLINMAESYVKEKEAEFIAKSMLVGSGPILKKLLRNNPSYTIGIVGPGKVGSKTLYLLLENYPEASFCLYDKESSVYTSGDIESLRQEDGRWQRVSRSGSIEQLFQQNAIVFSFTGHDITADLPSDFFTANHTPMNWHLISGSSGDIEFLSVLTQMPDYRFESLADIRDYTRALGANSDGSSHSITLYNGGFPANFSANQPKAVPVKEIQVTRAMKLASLVQALNLLAVMLLISRGDHQTLKAYMKLDARYQWEIIQAFYRDLIQGCSPEEQLAYKAKYADVTQEEISQRSMGIVQPTIEKALGIPNAYAEERDHIAKELALYISPFCCDENSSPDDFSDETRPLLENTVVSFIPSEQKVMLIKSESGGGKTLAGCSIELKNRQGKLNLPRDTFVIFISLPSLKDPVNNLIHEYFHRKFGDNADKMIREYKKYNICFILDAYDEIESFQRDITQAKNLYVTNRLYEWSQAKFIFTCRTSFLNQLSEKLEEASYKDFFAPVGLDQSRYDLLTVVQVVLFNPDQINQYIDQYARLKPVDWDAEKYKENIRDLPGIEKLIRSPLLLSMTVEALPVILEWHQARVAQGCDRYLDITKRDVFLAYLKINLRRQKIKVCESTGRPPPMFMPRLLGFLLNLCHEMKTRNLSRVEYSFQPGSLEEDIVNDGEAWATQFFGDPFEGKKPQHLQYLEILRHNLTCFLKYERGAWSFIHDSYIGRFNSINGLELGKIKNQLNHLPPKKIQQEAISEFSRILFDEAAGPYYLTNYADWADHDAREAAEANAPAELPRENLPLDQDSLERELRNYTGEPEIAADDRYAALIKTAVDRKLHLRASLNGNTALHWLLEKLELSPAKNQEKKLIVLLNEIKSSGRDAAEVLNSKNNKDSTVIDLFEEKKAFLSDKTRDLFQQVASLLTQTLQFR
jgi:hypothetical protein